MKYLDFLYIETESTQLSASHKDFLEIKKVQHTIPKHFNESYTYDTRGNRLTSLTNSYIYNDLNQLTSTTTHNYTYDADGNLIEEKNKITTETKKYYYNSENRLTRFEHYPTASSPADTIAAYKYDIYGRRLQKDVNGTVINFSWEGDNLAFEMDANYQPISRYVYGLGKDDVEGYVELSEVTGGMFDQSRQGWYSYIKDQVGTIYKVYSDNVKQMIDTRTYDTFGNIINRVGTSTGNLGFQGKYYDQESGLYYFYKRYYNPINGRFINEDPIGLTGGLNMYGFVENDPINFFDKFGLKTIITFWRPVRWGSSSFGHISVDINGFTYSFGPKGMHLELTKDYKKRNYFRDGYGFEIKISPEQEKYIENYLLMYYEEYNWLTNNCVDPIEKALEDLGFDLGWNITPHSFLFSLIMEDLVSFVHFYEATKPSKGGAPWTWLK